MKQLLSAHLLLTYPYSHPAQSTVPLVISAIAGYALPAAGGGGGGGASWLYGALVKGALLAAFASAAVFLGDGFDLVVTVGGASVRCRPLHTVAASITYGCSLHHIRLQPPSHTVAACMTYGYYIRPSLG